MARRPSAVSRAAAEADRIAREVVGKPETEEEAENALQEIEGSIEKDHGVPVIPEVNKAEGDGDDPLSLPDIDDPKEPESLESSEQEEPESLESSEQEEDDDEPDVRELLRVETQRYNTLRTKYDKEVPRLTRQVRRLEQENEALRDQIISDHKQSKEAKINALKTKMANDYDEGLVNDFTALVDTIASSSTPNLPVIPEDDEPDGEGTDETEIMNKVALLEGLVPNWQRIEKEPGCQEFLQTRDAITGEMYDKILMDAFNTGRLEICANIFRKYLSKKSSQVKAPALDNDLQPTGKSADTKRPKSESSTDNKRIWKISEINRIEAAARQGRYRGQTEKLKRLRDSIAKAAAEGRIDQSK